MNTSVTHVVFDLGGVIIELRGSPIRSEWFADTLDEKDIWKKWLLSSAPREFESGKLSVNDFAQRVVSELSLSVEPDIFLDYFKGLPIGPYDGAKALLTKVKETHKTALFSNSNAIHWERKMGEMDLGPFFDFHFASHLMGSVKPDQAAFEQVVSGLAVPAGQILFFDDNEMNVNAARQAGLVAEQVAGLQQLRAGLEKHRILR